MEIILAIVGTRDYDDYDYFCKVMDNYVKYLGYPIRKVYSGDAPGIDQMAEDWAISRGYLFEPVCAVWQDENGKKIPNAGYLRNEILIDKVSHCVAFWNGISKGTKHSYNLALSKKKTTIRIKIEATTKRYYSERHRKLFNERAGRRN